MDDMKWYRDRWKAVVEIGLKELQAASIELRWQQLDSVVGMAIGLGILKGDNSEEEVYQRWAKLKNKAADPHRKF